MTPIEELRIEMEKYHKLYVDKVGTKPILHELNADAFKMAISSIENKGLKDTYEFLKADRDKFAESPGGLSGNLAHAYGLVIGKLWKHYQNLNKEGKENEKSN